MVVAYHYPVGNASSQRQTRLPNLHEHGTFAVLDQTSDFAADR